MKTNELQKNATKPNPLSASEPVLRPQEENGADSTTTHLDIEAAAEHFRGAIATALDADVLPIPDGEIHRFDDPEKRSGNKNCWLYFDPSATYGTYGNWGTDERYNWYLDDFQTISDEELAIILEKVETTRLQRAKSRVKGHDKTAKKANQLFNNAESAPVTHRYLRKKCIPLSNARCNKNTLLIPLRNVDGDLRNLQRIAPSGVKRFLKGGEVSGNFSLIGADELPTEGSLIVCEGWATGVTIHQEHEWPVAAAMNAGNLSKVCAILREKLPDAVTIIVAADDDRRTEGNPGLAKALAAGDAIGAEVIKPEFPCTDCDCTDFNDVAACTRRVKPDKAAGSPAKSATSSTGSTLNQPIPLTTSLPPVKPLVAEMLPDSIGGFVSDAATRLQIPPDYLAVAVIAVVAGVMGGKYRIHPKQNDDWLVTPTVWAGLIGPPSTMKSACMSAASKPLQELEEELAKAHKEAQDYYQCDAELAEIHLKQIKKEASALYGEDREKAVQTFRDAAFTDTPPTRRRYYINDATVEKLGEIMSENPNGLILIRDELSGLVAKLLQEEHQADRTFYLECFEGNSSFTWDRITRGTVEALNCILSIVGGIQPSRIAPIIHSAINGQIDDGFIQRFQFAVWPDVSKKWKWVDQTPDEEAYASYRDALRQLHELPGANAEEQDCHLRFSKSAQALYITWTEKIQAEIHSDQLHPVMQSHLAKLPKTIAGLALLFELLDGGRSKVGKAATARAILWADYLLSHAERLYSLVAGQGMTGAKLILARRGKLPEFITARDVQRKSWAGLSSTHTVAEALECLVDHRYLSELPGLSGPSGGRPKMRYRWHSSITKK
jgi:putative DNA primase/helicase